MGQNQSSQLSIVDGVGAFVQASQDSFMAGEFVEGAIYLKTQRPQQVKSISVKFFCQERVNFFKHLNQQTTEYNVDGLPYEHAFQVKTFRQSQIQQGNFIFPFKLLLPSELPGSIFIDSQNFLRYLLLAEINVSGTKEVIKSNEIIIHLTEPFRSQLQRIDESVTNYPQCCDCCQSYGTVYTKLSCDRNLIKAGDTIKIDGQIDNSHGNVPVRNARVSLIMHVFKASPEGQKTYAIKDRIQIGKFGQIKNGTKKNISVTKKIPNSFSQQSTAFGTILAIYYTLAIESEMGLFSIGANISVPVHFMAQSPKVQKSSKLNVASTFSSSKTFPIFSYTNMKNQVYKPVEGMPNTNRRSSNPQGNLLMMNQNYMQSSQKLDNIYEIKKVKTVHHQRIQQKMEKDPADPDVAGQPSINYNKSNFNQNHRQRKYMDEENQNDYNQFKDFQQNQQNSWSRYIGAIVKGQIRF